MGLLRGADIGEVSRETRVASPELERWRRVPAGGPRGLKKKNRPGGELMGTRAALGRVESGKQPALPADDGVRGVAGGAFERVRAAEVTSGVRSPAAPEAGPEDGTERRGTPARDLGGPEGEFVPRRGPPEGEGAACRQGHPGRQEPGAQADAGARVVCAGAAGPSPRGPDP